MKKIVAVMLTVLLVASMTTAFAVPSITTSNLTKVKEIVTETGVKAPEDLKVEVVEDTPETVAALADIAAKVTAGEKLSDAFGVEIDEKLNLNDFCTVKVTGYTNELGALKMKMTTAATYVKGQVVKALVLVNGQWTEIEAEVVDGEVEITLPAEVLEKLGDQPLTLAILG